MNTASKIFCVYSYKSKTQTFSLVNDLVITKSYIYLSLDFYMMSISYLTQHLVQPLATAAFYLTIKILISYYNWEYKASLEEWLFKVDFIT